MAMTNKPKDRRGADHQGDQRDPPPPNSAFSKPRSCANLLKNAANSTKPVTDSMRAKENLFVNGLMPVTPTDTIRCREPAAFLAVFPLIASEAKQSWGPSHEGGPPGGLDPDQLGISPIGPSLPAP